MGKDGVSRHGDIGAGECAEAAFAIKVEGK